MIVPVFRTIRSYQVVKNDKVETVEYQLPSYSTRDAACMDIQTPVEFALEPGERKLINTGLIMRAPRGYNIQVLPRSGLALKYGVTVLNAPGTIDRDYCGPTNTVGVILINLGSEKVEFKAGDRIAQLKLDPFTSIDWSEQSSAYFAIGDTGTRTGGFGSTGIGSSGGTILYRNT